MGFHRIHPLQRRARMRNPVDTSYSKNRRYGFATINYKILESMVSTLRGGWRVGWLLLLHRRRDRPRTPAPGEGGDWCQLGLLAE